jgi:hypothetical protein
VHEKKYKTLTIKEMPIKATLRFHLTPFRMAVMKKANNMTVGNDAGKRNCHTQLVGT